MSLLRLIPQPPGKITAGEVWFEGKDLLKMRDEEIRQVRGNRIAMIFQDPMTSLNPVLTIGFQVSEALMLHMGMDQARPASARSSCWRWSASHRPPTVSMTIPTSSPAACASV